MFFAIAKFVFEESLEGRELHAFVKKVQARFPVCVRSLREGEGEAGSSFVVATLGDKEQFVSQQLDEIAAFAEKSGFGRISSEDVLFDHIDNLSDQAE